MKSATATSKSLVSTLKRHYEQDPICGFLLAFVALQAPSQTIQVNKDNRTIAITTTDEAQAIADRAVVSIGFTLYGIDQNATYADASKTSNAISGTSVVRPQ